MNRSQYLDLYKLILSTDNILENDIRVAFGLIDGGVDPNTKQNGKTLFHVIVKYGNLKLLKEYYDKGGNLFLKTPLCIAIDQCNVEMVEYILSKGVNANTYYKYSSNKLIEHVCIKDFRFQDSKNNQVNNSVELLHTLIYYGADIKEKFGDKSLLDLAKDNSLCNKLLIDYLEKIMDGYNDNITNNEKIEDYSNIINNEKIVDDYKLEDSDIDNVINYEEIADKIITDKSKVDDIDYYVCDETKNVQEIDFNSLWNLTNEVQNICANPFWVGTLQGYSEGILKFIGEQLPINLKEVPEIIELKKTFKQLGFGEFCRNFFEFDMINTIMYLNKFMVTDATGNLIHAGKLYFNMMEKIVNNIASYNK
jgi:hypothetical protein